MGSVSRSSSIAWAPEVKESEESVRCAAWPFLRARSPYTTEPVLTMPVGCSSLQLQDRAGPLHGLFITFHLLKVIRKLYGVMEARPKILLMVGKALCTG